MAQFRTDKNIIDSKQVSTRYEVFMLSDQITPSGSMVDSFGRFRTSSPFTLFESQMVGTEGNRFTSSNTGTSSVVYSANTSSVNLTVNTSSSDSAIQQTRRVMHYQPGKSLQLMLTFAMGSPKANVSQKVGYFDDRNGIYFENLSGVNYIVLRTNTSGVVVETKVPQSAWNIDRFDGTGYSSQSGDSVAHSTGINVTKTNVFWLDLEWLGVGDVRAGFVVDGKPMVSHIFHNDNRNTEVYMGSACLPVRYEIKNIGNTSGSTSLKQICSAVMSEGGIQGRSLIQGVSRGYTIAAATDLGLAGTEVPLISIRLAAGKFNSVVVPFNTHLYVDSNQSVSYRWVKNYQTLDGTWVQHPTNGSPIEYNITSTAAGSTLGNINGRTQVIQGGFVTAGAAAVAGGLETVNYDFQLGRFLDGTPETFTLTAIGMNNNTKVLPKMDWFQLV